MNTQDREMIALAKATLRTMGPAGEIARCNIGLGENELTLTVITLGNGEIVKCWNESKGITIRAIARKRRQEVTKVEFVVADRATKQPIRVKQTFNLVGNDLVQA